MVFIFKEATVIYSTWINKEESITQTSCLVSVLLFNPFSAS